MQQHAIDADRVNHAEALMQLASAATTRANDILNSPRPEELDPDERDFAWVAAAALAWNDTSVNFDSARIMRALAYFSSGGHPRAD